MSERRERVLATLLEVTVPVLALVIWGVASSGSDTYYFPPLTDILETFADTWLFERVGSDVVPSLLRPQACCSACRGGHDGRPPRSSSSCARYRRRHCCRSRSS
jgi:hypothetical protein